MSTTEIVAPEAQNGSDSKTLMAIIERAALSPDFDVAKLQQLFELKDRWEKREAEKAFIAALAAFKKHPPEILKNRKVSYTNKQGQLVEYKHATLDRVTGGIGAALGEHGLSADWETAQENGRIRITCYLQHEMGHREKRATLEGPPDDSGSKSNVQAIASTVTFLERYTLLASTGMATRDDSDGITFGDAEDMIASIRSAATVDELQERFNKIYKRAYAAKDKAAMAIAIETKDQRKKELEDPAKRKAREEFDAKWEPRGVNLAGRQMAIGKHNGDLVAADKELEEAAARNLPENQQASLASKAPASTQEPAAPAKKAGSKAKKETTGPPEETSPAPAEKKQDELGF